LAHLRELEAVFANIGHHILADLDHEHSVVTLGCKTSVSNGQVVSEFVN